jgi:hypothetical protein
MAMTAMTWTVMLGSMILVGGITVAAMYRTLVDEGRKVALLKEQGDLDTYSPTALQDLRNWIEQNPSDPYVIEGIDRYNECVRTLREIDEPFYDWSEEEIESLETL